MSERTHVQEVFTEVQADPDAILDAADAESPAALIAGGGKHESPENSADADENVAALLENLMDAAIETTGTSVDGETDADRVDDRTASTATAEESTPTVEHDSEDEPFEAISFGDPSVDVLSGDGAVIDGVVSGHPSAIDSSSDSELVGSPTVTRVPSDAFGSC